MNSRRVTIVLAVMLSLLISLSAGSASSGSDLTLGEPCTWGTSYNPACDVDHDNDVDVTDIQLTAGHWGQTGAYVSDGWSLTGNAGTTPGTHFLGTTDNTALELRVNGQRALRLEPGASDTPNVVGGSAVNYVASNEWGATIGGGGTATNANRVIDSYGTVSGGSGNQAGYSATVGGGYSNEANGNHSTVSGGSDNSTTGVASFVGGGSQNAAAGANSVIVGGWENDTASEASTVGGGWYNAATGVYSTIPGGYSNTASGYASFAAGFRAKAMHDGSFVLADNNSFDFASTTPNTLRARFIGGIRLVVAIDGSGNYTASCVLNESTVTWSCFASDSLKQDAQAADGRETLEKLASLPIMTWRARDDRSLHVGPLAEDFQATFGLGGEDVGMSTLDLDGVALASIQGLYQIVQQQQAQIAGLEARLAMLEETAGAGTQR